MLEMLAPLKSQIAKRKTGKGLIWSADQTHQPTQVDGIRVLLIEALGTEEKIQYLKILAEKTFPLVRVR